MLTLPQAVEVARSTARSLFKEDELKHLRVEEFQRSDNGKNWEVTLGWVEAANRTVGMSVMLMNAGVEALPRVYKRFTIDGETGEVTAMKIRD